MSKSFSTGMTVVVLLLAWATAAQEPIIFQQDFESDEVGQRPSGSWYFNEGTGASCLVSDEATDVPGSPSGTKNLKFSKAQTGSGTDLTVQWKFEGFIDQVMSSGKLTATYWVYFASGQLMRHIAFRGYSPYKQYMKMVVRGNWPDDIRLEFPINGTQMLLSGAAWHKLTFVMEWNPVWPLPTGGIPKSDVKCRFFVDDQEHPGSPANILEDLVSPFGSVELNTKSDVPAIAYFDDIVVSTAPQVKSLVWANGRLALSWKGIADIGGTPALYEALDPAGPWTLIQGNIESGCSVNPGAARLAFYRVGPQEPPSPDQKVIFSDDFEAYDTSEEVETIGGWSRVNGCGKPEATWRLWNTAGEPLNTQDPNLVGMSGNYMISNSDFAQDARLDEELISPAIDFTGYKNVAVEFKCHINSYEDDTQNPQITDLDVSTYDPDSSTWSSWTNIFSRDSTAGDWSSDTAKFFGLGPVADGRIIKVRWRFHEAQFDYWWAIDNVSITGEQL